VGIAGLTLGGGLGVLGRLHGLTSDALRAAEIVLADGRVIECDVDRDADLFWALRGAGGARFGVVTSLTFETFPAPAATAFELSWPIDDAAALLGAWQAWLPGAPDALAASLLVSPAGARVIGAFAGGEAEAARELERLARAAGAVAATARFAPGPFRAAKRFLSALGDEAAEAWPSSRSEFFARPLPADTVEALLRHLLADPVPSCERELDFSPWGGAYGRVPVDATAFAHRDALFLLKHGVAVAADAPASSREQARAWLERAWELTHPFGTGGSYPNFPEPDRDPWDPTYHGANRPRLLQVKGRYDPEGVFGAAAF
jgi:FAD/FMN-containing dehydrogenase